MNKPNIVDRLKSFIGFHLIPGWWLCIGGWRERLAADLLGTAYWVEDYEICSRGSKDE